MSKKQFKSSASAARAFTTTAPPAFGFASTTQSFGTSSSPLSYLNETANLSAISDSNVVVAFKNLSKRDATTKARALEDLQGLSLDNNKDSEIEDAVLDAWTSVYPRTSIDSSRRVRLLSHTLQGQIAAKSGKRIAKRMPAVVGAWLAGTYDTDKGVAKAAQDALAQVFTTPEKRRTLWKAYRDPLLDFCRNIFDNESPGTLSDERIISPDEAKAKYHRVLTCAVSLLSGLLTDVGDEDFSKHETTYREILEHKRFWDNSVNEEVTVRRSMSKLLRGLLQSEQTRALLDMNLISVRYIAKGAGADHIGSAGDFVDTLIALTKADPLVWTSSWSDKKPVICRLHELVKRGSQGASLNYWSSILRLIQSLPTSALPQDLSSADKFMKAFHAGITKKDEPRPFIAEGLKAYVQVAPIIGTSLPSDAARSNLLRESVLPLFSQYVSPKVDGQKWDMPPSARSALVQDCMKFDDITRMLLNELSSLSTELTRSIKLSLPEQAREYARSQDDLAKAGERFATLIAALWSSSGHADRMSLEMPSASVLKEAFAAVQNRNGKPYGAAAVAAAIISKCRDLIEQANELKTTVQNFLIKQAASVYPSPSYAQIAAIVSAYEENEMVFVTAWTACLNACLASQSKDRFKMLTELLFCRTSISESELENLGPLLAPEILPLIESVWNEDAEWRDLLSLLSKSMIAAKLFGEPILERVTESLVEAGPTASVALDGLRAFSKTSSSTLKDFLATDSGKKLLPNLLLLSETPDEQLSKEASELIPVVQGLLGSETSASGSSGDAVVDVIQSGLSTAGATSVSIDTLVNHAKGLLSNKMVDSMEKLLPDLATWAKRLDVFLARPVDKSLAITSPFGGAVFLVHGADAVATTQIERDAETFSVPLRMAMYTTKLFSSVPSESATHNPELAKLLTLTTALANDHLSVANASNLWSLNEPEIVSEVSDFVSAAQQLLKSWHESDRSDIEVVDMSTKSYYLTLAGSKLQSETEEATGAATSNIDDLEKRLKSARASGNTFSIISELYGHQVALADSTAVMRYCNELVADLTALDAEKMQASGLSQLIILNIILTHYEDAGETIAKPRLSRFISKAVSWLLDEAVEDELVTELYRMMFYLFPLVSDMYGDYWKNILESIKSNLELVTELPATNAPALVPSLHAAVRLFGVLRKVKSSENSKPEDERNDDVIEAWNEYESQINAALIASLKVPRRISDEQHQPLMILNELLSRELTRIPTSKLSDAEELYPQLYSPSPAVQQAAYRLLHRYVPAKQEQISLDTVLEKKSARLPDELLSLILETPVAADLHEEDFERSTPLQLRGYLLSWLLVFDNFTKASHKVTNDYVESMKDADHLGGFLDFTFDFLGHAQRKPLDVSRFDITSYNTTTMQDSPLKDTQWLLAHLYYLCLRHFPSLTKNWWMGVKSRQKSMSVESWTAKFVSPLVCSTALETVVSWASTQETAHTSEEPGPLVIRVNHQSRELTAAYAMDDEGTNAIIVITLPPTFPLHNAKVTSPSQNGNSITVDARRWNAWLLHSQAIIAFSNNSIIDGLLAWRRNVFGSLKGQTECAICYAVVGEEGRVPSKKCRVCKNLFHGGCLYKWFRSSNGSTCPLCREPFNYGDRN